MFSTSTVTTPKARVQHLCDLCDTPILRGTTYHSWTCFGDTPYRMKVHDECRHVASTLMRRPRQRWQPVYLEDCWDVDTLHEDLMYYYQTERPDENGVPEAVDTTTFVQHYGEEAIVVLDRLGMERTPYRTES